MRITVSNRLILTNIPATLKGELVKRLTFPNPKFLEAEKMGRWAGNIPRELCYCDEVEPGVIEVPRGFCRQLIILYRHHGIPYEIEDRRRTLPEVAFEFKGTLRPYQQTAVEAVMKRDFGVLSSATGSGKTTMALSVIAKRKQPTLVIVHNKELMHQWRDRAFQFLGLSDTDIGLVGDGRKDIGRPLTIGVVNSVYKMTDVLRKQTGFVISDECHRCPSAQFSKAVSAFDSRYMLGLSGTAFRRDKLTGLIFWFLGDLVHEVDKSQLVENGDILKAEVVVRETNFTTRLDPSEEYSKMLSELTQDPERNRLIASDVAREARNGSGVCLVLSDRKAHCQAIQKFLAHEFNTSSELLTGDLSKTQREGVIDRLNRGRVKVLIATGALVGEGFDCKDLSTLFLTTPVKFEGRLIQCIGRVLRPAPGKDKAKVYDYVDNKIGVLIAAAKTRKRVYKEL